MTLTIVLETHEGQHLAKFPIEAEPGHLPTVLKWGERYFELFDRDGVYRETRLFYDVPK